MCLLEKYNNIPVVSIIVPVALVSEPATIPGPSDDGIFKLRLNVSSSSTMLSFVTATLTVMLVAPAGIVTVRGVALKSLSIKRNYINNIMMIMHVYSYVSNCTAIEVNKK